MLHQLSRRAPPLVLEMPVGAPADPSAASAVDASTPAGPDRFDIAANDEDPEYPPAMVGEDEGGLDHLFYNPSPEPSGAAAPLSPTDTVDMEFGRTDNRPDTTHAQPSSRVFRLRTALRVLFL
jgi:hypothetical protein